MGVAPLRIEQGRYEANGRNDGSHGIPSEQRVCQVCDRGCEDEIHFLVQCNEYRFLRQSLFTWLSRSGKHAYMLVGSAVEVFSKLMASEDKDVVRRVVDYVWEAFKIRKAALKVKGIAV